MTHSIRFHSKSRTGCAGCKLRRVKCDEAKPQCAGCTRRREACCYAATQRHPDAISATTGERATESSQTTPVNQTPAESNYGPKHLLDLRMMHHYCTSTAESFAAEFPPDVASALKVDLPRLAYRHEFLMDAILLVAMVHLGCTEPESLETLPVYVYRDQALRTLRQAIGDISEENVSAARGASGLLAAVSFATDRVSQTSGLWLTNWLTLAQGRRNIHTQPAVSEDQGNMLLVPNLYGSFHDVPASTRIASGIQRAMQRDSDAHKADSETLRRAAAEVSRLIAALESPRHHQWLVKKLKAWAFDVIEPKFVELVRQERPCALVILAHYVVLFCLLPDAWVYHGLVSHDMEIIVDGLGSEWEECIVLPRMALHVKGHQELTELLLGCL